MRQRKTKWTKDPDDIRYRAIEALVQSLPTVLLYTIVSGLTQAHTNTTFDANEWHNLAEGAPAMAVVFALLRLRKLI
jgi:hypothetical protein